MALPRQFFSSRAATVFTMIGVAIGLGNVWRFPYMMGRYGGSAFLIVNLVFTLFFAIPAATAEWALGRATRQGPLGAFRAAFGRRPGTVVGIALLITVLVADSYYLVVIAQVVYTAWFAFAHGFGPGQMAAFQASLGNGVIQYSIAIGLLVATLVVMRLSLRRGTEFISKIFVPFFWLTALFLVIGALRLPHAMHYLAIFLQPRFDAMTPRSVFAAVGQAVFSLGLGGTFLLIYGSYLRDDTPLPQTAVLTAIGNSGASLLAALFIVPAILVFGLNMAAGPTLLFLTLPELFHRLPAGEWLGGAFLIGLAMVAFLSNIAALEVFVGGSGDLQQARLGRGRLLIITGVAEALLMLPSSFYPQTIAVLDLVFGSGMQALGSALALLALAWGLGRERALTQIFGAVGGCWRRAYFYWIGVVIPAVLFLVLAGFVYDALR